MEKEMRDYSKKIITIPNILSLFRLMLIPVIVWLYCIEGEYAWTILIILLSGATDIIDGFIARRFQMISDLGKILDPVADKLTQLAVLMCLMSHFSHIKILVVMFVIKEAFSAILGLIAIYRSRIVKGALWHGKLTTVALYCVMLLHLIWFNIPKEVSYLMIGMCASIMILSFVLYAIRNIRTIREGV